MVKSIIKIKNMSFKYNEEYLFKDFNLEITPGSFVSIIGKNGSGKSSLARILIGLEDYDGYINIDGYLLNRENLKKIRRVFSACFDNCDDHFVGDTVYDDLAFSLENLEYSKEEIDFLVLNMARKFKINNILDKSFNLLTSSEKEKIAICSSLIHNSRILLLDEATYKLNASDRKLVFKILKEYKTKNNLTIIHITHNLEDTLYSDRIIYLDKGNIVLDDSTYNIYSKYDEVLTKDGFILPFMVRLSHNLMLYDLIDKVYFDEREIVDKLWE